MAASAELPIPLTVTEFMQRRDDEPRAELVDGEIVLSPELSWIHQRIGKRIAQALDPIATARNLGEWFPPINLVLSPNTLFHPDLVFIGSGSGLNTDDLLVRERPLIALEILSPLNRRYDLIFKRSRYAEFEIPEYWICDPSSKTLSILLRNEQGAYDSVHVVNALIPAGIFEGVAIDLDWIFSGVAP